MRRVAEIVENDGAVDTAPPVVIRMARQLAVIQRPLDLPPDCHQLRRVFRRHVQSELGGFDADIGAPPKARSTATRPTEVSTPTERATGYDATFSKTTPVTVPASCRTGATTRPEGTSMVTGVTHSVPPQHDRFARPRRPERWCRGRRRGTVDHYSKGFTGRVIVDGPHWVIMWHISGC